MKNITMKQIWMGLTIILSLMFLFLLFRYNNQMKELNTVSDENNAIITELTAKVESNIENTKIDKQSDVTTETDKVTAKEVEQILHSATKLGEKVATLQNAYRNISFQTERDAYDANVNALDECFQNDSKNARVAWYTPSTEGVSSTWVFKSTYDFSDTTIKVVWFCMKDESDELLAYAVGNYNVADELFSNITYKMTRVGSSYIDGTYSNESTPEVTYDSLQSIINSISEINVDIPQVELSDEELLELREAQEKLRQEQIDAYDAYEKSLSNITETEQ